MISKKLVAASILAAMGTSAHALDPIKVGDWELQVSGSVNAYYTQSTCDAPGDGNQAGVFTGQATAISTCGADTTGNDNSNIQNGLLPGFIIFSAKTRQAGYDISGTISIDPGTSVNDGATTGGVGQTVGDNRRVFLTVGNENIGTFKLGRDIGMFGSNAILSDMSLLAVGGGSGINGAINTTLGSIGQGYVYTQFQPQISYTAPAIGGLTLSGGIFQPTIVGAGGERNVGFQGMATYTLPSGKLWATFINEDRDTYDVQGYEVGGSVSLAGFGLTGNYFDGEGLGTGVIGLGGATSTNQERDSSGYLVQATYTFGSTKFGINYGESELKAVNAADAASGILDTNEQYVVGIYHNLTPSLTLAAEYVDGTISYQNATADQESKTVALGAILFF